MSIDRVIRIGKYILQFGGTSTASTNTTVTIKLHTPFADDNYYVCYSWTRNANLVTKSWLGDAGANDSRKTDQFLIYVNRTTLQYSSSFFWFAFGRAPE